MENIINITDFMSDIKSGDDVTSAVFDAMLKCKSVKNPVLVFPKGVHHFWPDKAFEKYYFISNNDHGLKRIAFPVIGMENLTIYGGGSEFMFHGRMTPFVIDNSRNITIKNLSIDYGRPFFSQGEIVAAGQEYVDIKISKEEYPYKVAKDNIIFYSHNWESYRLFNLLEYDPKTGAPAHTIGDEHMRNREVSVEELPGNVVRFKSKFRKIHNPGNIMAILHEERLNPGIFSDASENISIEKVTIYHVGAMGGIFQNTKDVTIKNLDIKLREGTKRMVSAGADAMHFVNCLGKIYIDGCTFQNQFDDPLNVHGIYTTISRIISEDTIEVEYMHFQQTGIRIYHPGDNINFIDRTSLLSYDSAKIKEVIIVNQKFTRIVFEKPLPGSVKIGDAIENVSRMPDLIVRNCRAGNNRARGFLITTPGNVLIENNIFYPGGAAIKISGDANYWFESGAVRNVTIRGNTFKDCNYGGWGKATIDIDPEIKNPEESNGFYHSNIRIEENTFETFDNALLWAHSVDGLSFRNNNIKTTQTYKPFRNVKASVCLNACRNVDLSGNIIDGKIITSFDEVKPL